MTDHYYIFEAFDEHFGKYTEIIGTQTIGTLKIHKLDF